MSYRIEKESGRLEKLATNREVIEKDKEKGLTEVKQGQVITGTVISADEEITLNFNGLEITTEKSVIGEAKPGEIKSFEVVKANAQVIELRLLEDESGPAKPVMSIKMKDIDWETLMAKQEQTQRKAWQETEYQDIKNKLEQISSTLTEQDYKLLEKEGFPVEDFTVGGLSEALNRIKATNGSEPYTHLSSTKTQEMSIPQKPQKTDSKVLEELLSKEKLPVTKENLSRLSQALDLSDLVNKMDDKTMKVLISTEATPSVENIYKASFSKSSQSKDSTEKLPTSTWGELDKQIKAVIKEAGFEVNEQNLKGAKWLIENKLPLTKETFTYKKDLDELKLNATKEDILSSMLTGMKKGIHPKDVSLLPVKENTNVQFVTDIRSISDEAVTRAVENNEGLTLNKLIEIQKSLDGASSKIGNQESQKAIKSQKVAMSQNSTISQKAEPFIIKATNDITGSLDHITHLTDKLSEAVDRIKSEAENTTFPETTKKTMVRAMDGINHSSSEIKRLSEDIKKATEVINLNAKNIDATTETNENNATEGGKAAIKVSIPYAAAEIIDTATRITKQSIEISRNAAAITQEATPIKAQPKAENPSAKISQEVTAEKEQPRSENSSMKISQEDTVEKNQPRTEKPSMKISQEVTAKKGEARINSSALTITQAAVDITREISDITKSAMKLIDVAQDIEKPVPNLVQTESDQAVKQEALSMKEDRDPESRDNNEFEQDNSDKDSFGTKDPIYEELKAKRQLQEIRLKMTLEAAGNLQRKGFSVDTEELSKVVEALREQEDDYYKRLLKEADVSVTKASVDMLKETTYSIDRLKRMPSSLLGSTLSERVNQTITTLVKEGLKLQAEYEKAGTAYETLATVPNREYGDSLKKAFANSDTLLNQMGLETTEANRRAIRILGYNHMEVTREAVDQVKAYDQQVNELIRNLHPAVAVRMIKEGINPLTVPINELNRTIDQMKEEQGITSEDKYSTFLQNLQKHEGITDEERKAYIGIYRLLYHIDKSDGAAVGAVVHSDREVTLGNLLTAIQTSRKGSINSAINDDFGALQSITRRNESIGEQLSSLTGRQEPKDAQQTEYQSRIIKQIKEELTPQRLMEAGNSISYHEASQNQITAQSQGIAADRGIWDMVKNVSIEKLLETLNATEDHQEGSNDTITGKVMELRELSKNSEQAIRFLNDYRVPSTTVNIRMANAMLSNGESPIRKLLRQSNENSVEKSEKSLKELKNISDKLIDKNTMQDAYKEIETAAKDAISRECSQGTIDSRRLAELKSMGQQITFIRTLAEREFYQIPIETEHGITNMNLTILRGTDTSGRLSVNIHSEKLGDIRAEFSLKDRVLKGYFGSDSIEGLKQLQNHTDILEAAAQENNITIKQMDFGVQQRNSDSYSYHNPGKEETSVTGDTERSLYRIAKAMVHTVRMAENSTEAMNRAVS